MQEPEYIAYRIDLKKRQDFYSIDEAAKFFKTKKESLLFRARGYNESHYTGLKIKEKWLIFDSSKPMRYVQEVINGLRQTDIKWN